MKTIFYTLSILLLVSCQKYEQPPLLSLSGEYKIDKLTYENNQTGESVVLYPGETLINYAEIDVLDTINVGFTEISMDYSTIYFNPVDNLGGTKKWMTQCFYSTFGQRNVNDFGYLKFDYGGTTRVFKIIDDGVESLVLRTTGQYSGTNSSIKEDITYFLTRIGP